MADLNALIAQGYQFQAPPDPFAQYAKMQQLDVGEQTNQLNRMKMQEYQRGMEEQNQLRQLYSTPGVDQTSPEFSRRMAAISPTAYQAYVKSVQEGKKSAADIGLAEARTLEAGAGTEAKKQQLARDKSNFVKDSLSSLSFNPSDANITAFAEDAVLNKYLTPEQAQARKDQLLAMPINQRKIYLAEQGMSTADTAKLFESKPVEKTDGQTKWMEETNPRLPTFGQRMTGAPTVQMKATPGENLTASTAASRLAFDQQKFKWEKDNPGHDLVQGEGGEYFAVDKKTRVMTPLMVGGAAPAAAASMGGGQGARGTIGVTDGGRAAPAAGVPFVGKSAGMTEAQGNAALFGSGMAQAQNVLAKASSKGVDTAPVTTSIVQGIVKYVPFGVGDKLVQDVMSVAQQDPTKLFGPDVEQQKVGQAQLAFAISYLRKTSGANFGQSELVNTMNEFFPSIGEDKAMVTQKAKARERVVQGMKLVAGPQGGKFIKQYEEDTSGIPASANDPLGLRK